MYPRVSQGHILHHQHPLHCFVPCHGLRWKISLPRCLFPGVLCLPHRKEPPALEMVLLSQTSSSTLSSYWEPEIKAGEKRLIHPCNPLRAPRATALGFPYPKLISLVALGGFFFLEFLELVPDPVPAFHLSWQFPVASVLLSSWDGQMAWRAVHSKVWLLTAGSASLQVRDQDWEHLHGGRGPQGSV